MLIKILIIELLIISFLISPLSAGKNDLDNILKQVRKQQERIENDIKDMIYNAKSISLQKNNKREIEKVVHTERMVYHKKPDKIYNEYLSMKINDKEQNQEDMQKVLKKQRKRRKRNVQMKSPFSPEVKNSYEYEFIKESKLNNDNVWIIGFKPKEKKQEFVEGKAYISKKHFNVLYLDCVPSKPHSVIKKLEMHMTFSPVQGYWLPLKFEMSMHIKAKFILTLADRYIDVEDNYSNYKINNGLDDSFFLRKNE